MREFDAMDGDNSPNSALGEFFFDESNKIRILEPEVEQQTVELRDECKDFVEKTEELNEIANEILQLTKRFVDEVDKEKMKAIACRNLLQSLVKARQAKRQQVEAFITEKRHHLERLRLQYASLQKVEAEQMDFLEQFLVYK